MNVPFTWTPTGWHRIRWSPDPGDEPNPSYEDHQWYFVAGYPNTPSADPDDMIVRRHSRLFGLGGAISLLEGVQTHRTVFATTPIDDGQDDLELWRYQAWIDQPIYSKVDAKGDATLRKRPQAFCDVDADGPPNDPANRPDLSASASR